MRLLSFIFFLSLCCNIHSQVHVIVQEPSLLEQQIGKDSTLCKKLDIQKHVKVTGVLAKEDIHFIAAISKKYGIKQLDLSKTSFREIGFGLFENCDSLKTIKLPNTVRTIAKNAFKNCISLQEIEFPKSLTSVGTDAFYNCTNLKKVIINKKLSWIGTNAFYGCSVSAAKQKGRNKDFYIEANHLYSKNRNRIF